MTYDSWKTTPPDDGDEPLPPPTTEEEQAEAWEYWRHRARKYEEALQLIAEWTYVPPSAEAAVSGFRGIAKIALASAYGDAMTGK